MKTKELLSLLEDHKNKALLFEYRPGLFVGANYHITEVKNITVDAIDCGGNPDFWQETVVQLWESPSEVGKKDYMTIFKALGILNKVDGMKPMNKNAEIKFEYSNPNFHTAQLFVSDVVWNNEQLIVKLAIEKTDCKAKETCGVPPVATETVQNGTCSPGSGCC